MLTSFLLASGVLHAPLVSNSTDTPISNGHLSPPAPDPVATSVVTSDSESALSDAVDDPPSLPSNFNPQGTKNQISNDRGRFDEESSQEDDASGSEDPDFDAETPPPQTEEPPRDDLSLSSNSPRQRKRKLGTEDEDHIHDNPELYGLRRSVCRNSMLVLNR